MDGEDRTEARRLADALQAGADDPMWSDHCELPKRTAAAAATLLREQAAELERLRAPHDECPPWPPAGGEEPTR